MQQQVGIIRIINNRSNNYRNHSLRMYETEK